MYAHGPVAAPYDQINRGIRFAAVASFKNRNRIPQHQTVMSAKMYKLLRVLKKTSPIIFPLSAKSAAGAAKSNEGISASPRSRVETKKSPIPSPIVPQSLSTASHIPETMPPRMFSTIRGMDKAATSPMSVFISTHLLTIVSAAYHTRIEFD